MITARRLQGIFTALPTPVHADGTVHAEAVRTMVRRQLDAGVAGLVPVGGTGEYGALAAAEREALRASCTEARDYQRALSRRMTADFTDKLKKEGMTVTPLAPAEVQKMRERLQSVTDRYTAQIGPELVAQAQQELAKLRSAK